MLSLSRQHFHIILRLFALFYLAAPLPSAHAEKTVYVSDLLVINIRSSVESPFTVIASVRSEEPLVILEEQEKYLYVETAEGKKGWIARQYVKSGPTKSMQIEELQQKNKQLSQGGGAMVDGEPHIPLAEKEALADELNEARKEIEYLRQQMAEMRANGAGPSNEEIERNRKLGEALREEKLALEQRLSDQESRHETVLASLKGDTEKKDALLVELQQKLEKLDKLQHVYWFLAGAGVFFIGLLTGKISFRKKSKYAY